MIDLRKEKESLAGEAFPPAVLEERTPKENQKGKSLQPVNQKIADRGSALPAPAPLCIFRLTGFPLCRRLKQHLILKSKRQSTVA